VMFPFTLGGTATPGTDYYGVTPSPVTFASGSSTFIPGQTTATITGKLLSDSGGAQTLTFTLGAPTGAVLGATTVNTLTIVEPSVTASTAARPANAGTLSIAGSGFNLTAAYNFVSFNDGALGTVTSATATELTVTFSKLPTAGPLIATVNIDGLQIAPVQVATVTPLVTSRKVQVLGDVSTIVIDGFGFDPTAANNLVTFNDGTVGVVTAATATSLTVTVTTSSTSVGNLTAVVTTDGASSGTAVQIGTVETSYALGSSALTEGPGPGSDSVALTVIPETIVGCKPRRAARAEWAART